MVTNLGGWCDIVWCILDGGAYVQLVDLCNGCVSVVHRQCLMKCNTAEHLKFQDPAPFTSSSSILKIPEQERTTLLCLKLSSSAHKQSLAADTYTYIS